MQCGRAYSEMRLDAPLYARCNISLAAVRTPPRAPPLDATRSDRSLNESTPAHSSDAFRVPSDRHSTSSCRRSRRRRRSFFFFHGKTRYVERSRRLIVSAGSRTGENPRGEATRPNPRYVTIVDAIVDNRSRAERDVKCTSSDSFFVDISSFSLLSFIIFFNNCRRRPASATRKNTVAI